MLRILTQTIIVPSFVMKVTEYLCTGWFFFLQTNFDFELAILTGFLYQSKSCVVLSLNVERYFSCDFFPKVMGV